MDLKIVHINVETRHQYGTCEDFFVGIFDDEDQMDAAIKYAENKYKSKQHCVKITDVVINKNNLVPEPIPKPEPVKQDYEQIDMELSGDGCPICGYSGELQLRMWCRNEYFTCPRCNHDFG